LRIQTQPWASEGGQGALVPLDLKFFSKKVCFLSFEWEKNKFYHFWPSPGKILEKTLVAPPVKIFLTTMNTAFGIGDGNNN